MFGHYLGIFLEIHNKHAYLDAWLFHAVEPDHENGVQVRDVTRREAQSLDLGQLPVCWF